MIKLHPEDRADRLAYESWARIALGAEQPHEPTRQQCVRSWDGNETC